MDDGYPTYLDMLLWRLDQGLPFPFMSTDFVLSLLEDKHGYDPYC